MAGLNWTELLHPPDNDVFFGGVFKNGAFNSTLLEELYHYERLVDDVKGAVWHAIPRQLGELLFTTPARSPMSTRPRPLVSAWRTRANWDRAS